ncbi:MAG: SBBP repeat-containing protein [Candidatus Acidiferrales bacterium]
MQMKSPLGKFAASVAVALAIATLFIFVMIHHGRSAARALSSQSAGVATTKAVPANFDRTKYGQLALEFEANQGQTASDVRFLSHGDGYTLFLTGDEAVITLRQPTPGSASRTGRAKFGKGLRNRGAAEKVSILRMRLDGANANATVSGVDRMPTKVNYFIGNDPKKWHTDVPAYSQVEYQGIYPGVDLLFYGNQRSLEYDFVVAPGANANQIVLDVQGASKLHVDAHGNLLMNVRGDGVELQKPIVYQHVNGERIEVAGNYAIANDHEVRFVVSNYDRTLPLTIDPVLNYISYLGGSGSLGDEAFGIALDAAGDAYVAGFTSSTDFPTMNPESPAPPDTAALGTAFVSELNPTGSALLYSAYLGGSGNGSFGDLAAAVAVDTATPPNIYVTGFTGSPDFPLSANALLPTAPGGTGIETSGFVTKLIPGNAGSAQLGYSSYLGGNTEDEGNGIAVDATGNAYVAGVTLSTDFPTTANALYTSLQNPNGSAFLTVINPAATTGPSSEVFSTYFGGTNGGGAGGNLFGDAAFGLTIDTGSNAYLVGTTTSTDFPTAGTAVSPCSDDANGSAFVSVINAATPALSYSTCLGAMTSGTVTQGQGIALGPNGVVYATGQTTSADFPVTANSIPAPSRGVGLGVVFVSLLNTTSTTPNKYSTFLGGTNSDFGESIAADTTGNAYVTGFANSTDYPVTQGALIQTSGNLNGTGFVAKINPGGNGQADLVYSSYFGGNGSGGINDISNGIALSSALNAYITGMAGSSNLPVTSGVLQNTLKSAVSNAFVADLTLAPTISASPTSLPFGTQLVGATTAPMLVSLTNNTSSAITLTIPATITGTNPADFAESPGTCTTSLAAGGTCTIGATFTPAAAQAYSATLKISYVFSGITGTSLQIPLTGTGSTTIAEIGFSPTSLTFPGQLLTTTSAGQTLTVSNPSTANALTITAITASTDYTIASNSCGAVPVTIAASPGGTPCMLSITFNPSATSAPGADNGTIMFTDNASGSPQSFTLNGTAWDFSVTAGSASVAKGAMGTFPVTITGLGGFTGAVSFTCTPGSSLVTACAVPTTSAAAAPGAMVNGTLTAASFIVAPESIKVPPTATPQQLFLVMLAIALMFMIPATRRLRTRLGMAGAMLVFIMVAGCTGNRPKPKTTTLTVTPSSGGVTKPAITVSVTIT